mmetsp:Transcript_12887/g.39652  ORF Transcript_12887/g.39652 Transcript_12887/m.39652 type:complete len:171 (+) Transcript_12887:285-797(+)
MDTCAAPAPMNHMEGTGEMESVCTVKVDSSSTMIGWCEAGKFGPQISASAPDVLPLQLQLHQLRQRRLAAGVGPKRHSTMRRRAEANRMKFLQEPLSRGNTERTAASASVEETTTKDKQVVKNEAMSSFHRNIIEDPWNNADKSLTRKSHDKVRTAFKPSFVEDPWKALT